MFQPFQKFSKREDEMKMTEVRSSTMYLLCKYNLALFRHILHRNDEMPHPCRLVIRNTIRNNYSSKANEWPSPFFVWNLISEQVNHQSIVHFRISVFKLRKSAAGQSTHDPFWNDNQFADVDWMSWSFYNDFPNFASDTETFVIDFSWLCIILKPQHSARSLLSTIIPCAVC